MKINLPEEPAKRIVLLLGISQVIFILLAAVFGGHAQRFCQPKSDYCAQTIDYFRFDALEHIFLKVWLVPIVGAPIAAFFCPRKGRQNLLLILLLMPAGEWIFFVLSLIGGL
jgi:hypothetical protein